ncbi:hypothetical protein [Curtobacterium sp. MCBD17_008]|uniref:hypothetical protein n=1 Tax=Curtobacterium sp. MCBD17_008 TaxID=2175656 RepID=UPI000DA8780F|nr:hypothetical protein [Curtobacterium sp. MCBD17_008]PZE93390.1 hypothetical protein DEI95_06470 [Curtobacterium sp. MCBD17_008]
MIDPPDSAVFVAPDGDVYVDRDGPGVATVRRWRDRYDPVAVRRRQRRAAWGWTLLALLTVALVAAAGLGVGLLVSGSFLRATVFGAGGVVIGIWFCLGAASVLISGDPRNAAVPVVPVPAEVLTAAQADASAADVWRWSVAVATEADRRRTIGYETYVERPHMQKQADDAREQYAVVYRAYLEAARELGVPPREPDIPLEVADQSGTGSAGGSGDPLR